MSKHKNPSFFPPSIPDHEEEESFLLPPPRSSGKRSFVSSISRRGGNEIPSQNLGRRQKRKGGGGGDRGGLVSILLFYCFSPFPAVLFSFSRNAKKDKKLILTEESDEKTGQQALQRGKKSFFVSLQKKGKKRNIASGPFISRMMPKEKGESGKTCQQPC